ncbi:hypothetical protein QQ045_015621 [Rhodiola kirilowii]
MWLRNEGFREVVGASWNSQPHNCSLSQKLKACMQDLSRWGSETFGNVKRRINDLKDNIQHLRGLPRTEERAQEEMKLTEELDEWLEREELWWRQRARAEWLKHGDKNTAYFHARASQRRKRNHIGNLRNAERDFCISTSEVYATITNYFTNIFSSQVDNINNKWRQESRVIPKVVTEGMNRDLTTPFTEGEVKRALYQMHPSKAPGMDGLSAAFYQVNWEVVGADVVRDALSCLNNNVLDTKINETLIVLVPKVKKVEKVEERRPISLCNVVMKVITKVLANRLKDVLPDLISQSQSAFVRGRLISDNILIAHEVSHYIKCRDQQKTGYVSLSWT